MRTVVFSAFNAVVRRRAAFPLSLMLALALAAGPVAGQSLPETAPPVRGEAPAFAPPPAAAPVAPSSPAPSVPAVDLPTTGFPSAPATSTGDEATPTEAAPADAAAPAEGEPVPLAHPDGGQAPVSEPGVGEHSQLPHDLSPWGMFMAADIVVQAVMVGLAVASLAVWTVWLAKLMELLTARIGLRRGLRGLAEEPSLDTAAVHLTHRAAVARGMVQLAQAEIDLSEDVLDGPGLKERVASRLAGFDAALTRRMRRGMSLLATVGSTAPFIGLFGTVWGIMNSFIGISKSQTTSLAVVAPGIAEALLATGIGLVAAIPAVILYNHLTRSIAGYRALVRETSDEVQRLVSRDIDRRALSRPSPALMRRG